jgi:hypothetical protein
MSRIRSIHPGLWTDEAFMRLSAYARLLYIGLWNEAFDDGVFEWKPLTLKAKLFPVDNVNIDELLLELEEVDCIVRREYPKLYGLIRNFRHYQRPKKPNSSGLLRHEDHEYVGVVPNLSPTSTEKSSQMEEGGGRMEEEAIEEPPALSLEPAGARDLFGEAWEAFPRHPASVEALAEAAFRKLKPKDQERCVEAAKRFRLWFEADNRERDRTDAAGARFVMFMSKWIETGAWKQAETMLIPGQPTAAQAAVLDAVEYVDRHMDAALFEACERIRNKPAPVSSQHWAFPAEVVAQARKELAH